MISQKYDVLLVSSEGYAIVHSKGLFVITKDGKREFASQYFQKYSGEYWYLKIPILEPTKSVYFLSDCQIDWSRVDTTVLQIVAS
ncbi:hypothetical protein ACR3IL_10585 [Streptococcus iniae]|nr:hypothetical protein BKX95_11560 [Streptococcus iniae]